MSARSLDGAAAALRGGAQPLLDAWLTRFERSQVRLPGGVDRDRVHALLVPVALALAEALDAPEGQPAPALAPGSQALREVEQRFAFLGAGLAAQGTSGFDAFALVLSLRDTLVSFAADDAERAQTLGLFDWFGALALASFSAAERAATREKARELLEERSPVVCVAPELPAAFLLADEAGAGIEPVLARLALLCVRVGAARAIIDASGLLDAQAPPVLDAIGRFFAHPKVRGALAVTVVGLRAAELRVWRSLARPEGVEVAGADTFLEAVTCRES